MATPPVRRWLGAALSDGRSIFPATFPALWLGFAFLPGLHLALQVPVTLALATLVGVGAELSNRTSAAPRAWRQALGALWFVPSGCVIVAVLWLSASGTPPPALAPVAALGVLGLMSLQRLELGGPRAIRGIAHAVNIGAAFAIAFAAYAVAAKLPAATGAALVVASTLPAALVVLRGTRSSQTESLLYPGVTALAVGELALVLHAATAPVFVSAALLVVALYAVSGVCRARLDAGPRRVYVELAITSVAALLAVGAATIRP